MTIQWTLVALFLYLEIGFIFLLSLPFITPKIWHSAFYSRVFRIVREKANIYFTVFIIVLVFFLLDSIREMINYSRQTPTGLGQELQIQLKLFRSQRNYYISGFAFFLWLVIRRLVMLVLTESELVDENESVMKRAQNATETLEKMLKKKEEVDREISLIVSKKMVEKGAIQEQIEHVKNELDSAKVAMKFTEEKAISVSKEYEDLLEKYTSLLKESEDEEQETPEDDHSE